MPTWFLKENSQTFVPVITRIVNTSLRTGVFPTPLKHAVITPIIKKQSLDRNLLKNYRPVSNIPFISKVIEKQAIKSITDYMTREYLAKPLQSAYRALHSTESALLKVKDDIMQNLSQRKGVFLVLLDLSAAFDTVNHSILLDRLSHDVGIKGVALKWIESYLTGRTTSVCINGVSSDSHRLRYGLPQGSIVGPQSFSIYSIPIGRIIRKHNLQYHLYADDIQLYVPFDIHDEESISTALSRLSSCISDIKSWMTLNMLKLNEQKTEFFIAVPDHLKSKIPPVSLQVGDKVIKPSDSVRNLGVVFDSSMSMHTHIKTLCSSLTYHLRNITRIRKFMDNDTCHLIVRALILSRLDYGNGLLLGSNACDIQRLQRIQNWAAKLICMARKFDHATPSLQELHWLPVRERVTFKILVTVFKCLSGVAPGYLSSCLSLYKARRVNLRSASDTTRLTQHSTIRTLKSASNRTFTYIAPAIWNHLPAHTRNHDSLYMFKKSIKTYLYPNVVSY